MKALEQFRQSRRQVYEDLFGPNSLAAAGLAVMPALLFNPSTALRTLLFLFFWFLAWLSGGKNRPLLTLLVILGIVVFNLIIPYGRVLFSAGPLKVTQGALATGIHRAVTLEALIMLSRLAIRPDLRLPGFLGELLGESFRFFSILINQKHRVARKTLIADIDGLLFELSGEDSRSVTEADAVKLARTKPAGYVVLVVVVVISWTALVWGLIA